MTREELELKAKEYALSKWEGQVPWGLIQQGYIEGYNDGRKENEKLKEQIEQMKCCRNCKHWNVPDHAFDSFCEECDKCKNYSLWELAE